MPLVDMYKSVQVEELDCVYNLVSRADEHVENIGSPGLDNLFPSHERQ